MLKNIEEIENSIKIEYKNEKQKKKTRDADS